MVAQIMKRFNQQDGRPNRYSMISAVGLNGLVRTNKEYRIRITENGSMRHSDEDISLKTVHSEWGMIRKNQFTKIPRVLWDKLVDTLCGKTATGDILPYSSYSLYDQKNQTSSRIGLSSGQVLCDYLQARASIKAILADNF